MKILTRKQTAEFLNENDNFVILTHRRPDGDTLGSAALLCRGLRKLGKNAHILRNPEITEKYAHLHQGLTTEQVAEGAVLIAVDTASRGMLPEAFSQYADRIILRIDHHATADSFTDCELVEPETAACGELVARVLSLMGVQLDKTMANALYTAISTDTGCFRYANTTAETFEVAAHCAYCGADLFAINQALFETRSLGRLRLEGWLIEHMLFLQEGKVAICALPKAIEEELGLTEDDLENISGFPRSIEGVKIAATIREDGENRVKISVRAVPGYDAAAICAQFGGGGHKGAAGASMNCSMAEAVEAIKKVMPTL
ncbi:MAG: DHH family phosphoesterase [Oscillospiraceae bacterium]|nr:DHH family phosphoesterase [Oscillospiraceae bacterium]